MQGNRRELVGDYLSCGLLGFPAAILAGSDFHVLSVQGLADLLDCMTAFEVRGE